MNNDEKIEKLNEQNNRLLTQLVEAEVIEIGDDEAEDGFSYKYRFINPLTSEECEAYDSLKEIEEGERIYDIGESVNVVFSEHLKRPGEKETFSLTRFPEYPEVLKKEKRKSKTLKIIYILIILMFSCYCTVSSLVSSMSETTANQNSEASTVQEKLD